MSAILVTGATGFLGREVARALLARSRADELVVLIRAADDAQLERRVGELGRALEPCDASRLRPVRGDVCEPGLGLGREAQLRLARSVERVVHVAASTRFDHPLEEARRQNVESTRHVLALCRALRDAGREARLDHVSSAYVAGTRVDLVREDDCAAPPGFRNSYEQSKFEAERLCLAARSQLPVVIHRPSIIVGSSSTGSTSRYHGFYEILASAARIYGPCKHVLTRLFPLPFDPDCTIDLVPVDYVATAIARLFDRPEAPGRRYHLTAGAEGASTVRELVGRACVHFDVTPPRYLKRTGLTWRLAARSRFASRLAPRLHRRARLLLPYTWSNPRFDTANARAAGLSAPAVSDYLLRVLSYAAANGFGRTDAATQAVAPGERRLASGPSAAAWLDTTLRNVRP
jgi:thioester reductase-like protein